MDSTAIVDRYIAIWNETDPDRRRELIARAWADACRYVDPVADVEDPAGIDALVGGFQRQFPGLTFARSGEVEAHHDRIRFSWDLLAPDDSRVAAGTDVAIVTDHGLLRDVAGFFDMAPVLPDAAREGAAA